MSNTYQSFISAKIIKILITFNINCFSINLFMDKNGAIDLNYKTDQRNIKPGHKNYFY